MKSVHCVECDKVVFSNEDESVNLFEDNSGTILHDIHKCYNFKHFSKLIQNIEDDIQKLRLDVKQVQELLF